MKIYSAIYNDAAHLTQFGDFETVYQTEDLDCLNSILILHGGADISPSLYNEKVGKYTHAGPFLSKRDKIELDLAEEAISLGIPIFGICRGAQLLTAIAGGKLVQDVTNHACGKHKITTEDGTEIMATSAHHQMCNPDGTEHELLAWSTENRSTHYLNGDNQNTTMLVEPEVIFYPKLKALAVQAHPEWMDLRSNFVQYCLDLVDQKLIKGY